MIPPVPTAPTPDPEYKKGETLTEVRTQMERNKKFLEDLRIFLRVPLTEFKTFQNPKLDLINRIRKKIETEEGFDGRLREFLEFCQYSADRTSEKIAASKTATSEKVQAVLEKTETKQQTAAQPIKKGPEKKKSLSPDPEQIKKKSWINDLLNCGYPLSGSGYYQIEAALKASLRSKPGFFGKFFGKKLVLEQMTDQPIQPHQVMEHLYRSLKNKKRSPLSLGRIQAAAEKLGIPFKRRTPEHHEIPLNPGFVLTEDGYCLVVDQDTCSIQFDPVQPEVE